MTIGIFRINGKYRFSIGQEALDCAQAARLLGKPVFESFNPLPAGDMVLLTEGGYDHKTVTALVDIVEKLSIGFICFN